MYQGCGMMVDVAQLVEPRIVIPVVVGSNPIVHPKYSKNSHGKVAKLVDALDLGSSGATRESSSLSFPNLLFIKGLSLMSVAIEQINDIERKFTATVSAEEIEQESQKRLQDLAKKTKIDGFRKGNVPIRLIKQRFGASVHAEAVSDAVGKSYFSIIKDQELHPAAYPKIEYADIVEGNAVTYTATFDVFPVIEVKDFSTLAVEHVHTELTDADIDAAIQKLREQRAKKIETQDPVVEGDRIAIDYDAYVDGKRVEAESKHHIHLTLGQDIMLPGFEAALVGKKPGEPFNIALHFPDDYPNDDVKGKDVDYNVTIAHVDKKELPELDDAFAERLGVTGGITALREEVKKNLEREVKYRLKGLEKKRVFDQLLAEHDFSIPKSVVDQEAHRLQNRGTQYLKQYAAGNNKLPELPVSLFIDEAKKNVKLGLLFAEIVKKFDLKPDPVLVEEHLKDVAAMYDDAEEAISWLKSNKQQLQNIEAGVLEDQVVALVLSEAKVEKKVFSYEELMKQQ